MSTKRYNQRRSPSGCASSQGRRPLDARISGLLPQASPCNSRQLLSVYRSSGHHRHIQLSHFFSLSQYPKCACSVTNRRTGSHLWVNSGPPFVWPRTAGPRQAINRSRLTSRVLRVDGTVPAHTCGAIGHRLFGVAGRDYRWHAESDLSCDPRQSQRVGAFVVQARQCPVDPLDLT